MQTIHSQAEQRFSRSRRVLGGAILAVTMLTTLFAGSAQAAYRHFDDDIVNGRTAQAEQTGNWRLGSASGGLVRWHYDDSNGVKRGEFKAQTFVRARPGTNPLCIAARVRWQTLTASPSFSLPPGASVAVGIQTHSNGWITSCRSRTSATPPTPIYMNGVAFSSRMLLRVHADVCHKATATSMWACATDTNAYGGD